MRTRIKICCIASIEEMRLALELGADAIGLVGAMPSGPGPIDDDLARSIALAAPPPLARFLLTSRTRAAEIAEHAARCAVDTVQIVSHVDPLELDALARALPHLRRVQVVHVEDDRALSLAATYASRAHALLLDSGRPSAKIAELGGTGRAHDWALSAEIVRRSCTPVFLAGGLRAENVGEAIARVAPFGVDVCSGVRSDGRLDRAKLAAFVAAVHAADAERAGFAGTSEAIRAAFATEAEPRGIGSTAPRRDDDDRSRPQVPQGACGSSFPRRLAGETWVAVFTGPLVDATLRQAKLGASGITARIPEADGRTFDPHFSGPTIAIFDLLVPEMQERRALDVMARPDTPLPDDAWSG